MKLGLSNRRDIVGETNVVQQSASRRSTRLRSLLPAASDEGSMVVQKDDDTVLMSSSSTIPDLEILEDKSFSSQPDVTGPIKRENMSVMTSLILRLTVFYIYTRPICLALEHLSTYIGMFACAMQMLT